MKEQDKGDLLSQIENLEQTVKTLRASEMKQGARAIRLERELRKARGEGKPNRAKPTKAQIEEWKRDTACNNHAGVLVKISTWAFENAKDEMNKHYLETAKRACEEMLEGRDREGCINNYLYCTNAVMYFLADYIRKEYGEETFKEVWKGI